jgi:DNA-binding PadR family transcriptional regulator
MPAATAPPPSSESKGASPRPPTTASFACLALLGERTLTATQIIDGMRTSGMRYLWRRADSRLYEEPRHLCEQGLAEVVGPQERGRGTRYRMTAAGHEALLAWLDEPGGPPSLEYEALLKAYCSVRGSREQLLLQLGAMREHVARGYAVLLMTTARLAEAGFQTEPLTRVSAMLFEYSRYELDMRARWLVETEAAVANWPDGPPDAEELAAVQQWFLARNQDVAESLRRFRAGEPPEVGARRE